MKDEAFKVQKDRNTLIRFGNAAGFMIQARLNFKNMNKTLLPVNSVRVYPNTGLENVWLWIGFANASSPELRKASKSYA